MSTHRIIACLAQCKSSIEGFPTSNSDMKTLQTLDTQMEEMQQGSENQCCQIFSTVMLFSEPVQTYHLCCREYQGLLCALSGKSSNINNAYHNALQSGITSLHMLNVVQCKDGIEACIRHLQLLKRKLVGLQKVRLRDSYILAKATKIWGQKQTQGCSLCNRARGTDINMEKNQPSR